MSKKKSIVSSFGQFTNFDAISDTTVEKEGNPPSKAKPRVAAGVIGATQRSMTEIREERDRLLAEAAKGHQLLTLDPKDIDPSPFRDRLPDDDDHEYVQFKKSIEEEGQKTPISVRRHPDQEHRYQVAFGHRRWRAMLELGLSVEAKLGEFSDRDLVVAQGIENANRQDLSWIEKALFCAEMENAGIKAKDIKSALSVDDSELSKFRSVTRKLPASIVEKIGRAPKVGRPRWLELADKVAGKAELALISKTLAAAKVLEMTSNDRFSKIMTSLAVPVKKIPEEQASRVRDIGSFGKVTFGKRDIRFVVDAKHAEGFKSFMEIELDELRSRYLKSLEQG